MNTLAYTHVGYLIAGWGIALGAIGIYAISLMRRAKSLTAKVPVNRQRWISTDD